MFRFVARRIPRFRLSTLCATMIVVVSVAGAVRHGGGPERQETAALQALQDEGVRFSAARTSGTRIHGETEESWSWNPTRPLANWIAGASDRLEWVDVHGWPSETTRQALFDLPELKRVTFNAGRFNAGRGGSLNAKRTPTPEEILQRRLPDLSNSSAIEDEPPPLPHGVPLEEDEREAAIREMAKSWDDAPQYPATTFLCVTRSSDLPRQTLVTAVREELEWRLFYERLGQDAYATTEMRTDRVVTRQAWVEDGWRTVCADRGWYRIGELFDPLASPPHLDHWCQLALKGDPQELYDRAERLEDGALLLHLKPRRILPDVYANPPELTRGVLIVDPAAEFAVRRIELDATNLGNAPTSTYRQILEYDRIDGHLVPVRRLIWTDLPSYSFRGQERAPYSKPFVTEHRWEFDPDLPADLFSPTRSGGEYFSADRAHRFPWWYVSGTASLCWLAVVSIRRLRSPRTKRAEIAREDSPIAIAESAEAS